MVKIAIVLVATLIALVVVLGFFKTIELIRAKGSDETTALEGYRSSSIPAPLTVSINVQKQQLKRKNNICLIHSLDFYIRDIKDPMKKVQIEQRLCRLLEKSPIQKLSEELTDLQGQLLQLNQQLAVIG